MPDRVVQDIQSALSKVIDPELRRPITELGMVGQILVSDQALTIEIKLTVVGCPAADRIESEVEAAARQVSGGREIQLRMGVMDASERAALTQMLTGGRVKANPFTPESLTRVLLVGSGKGGVGKTSVTVNLAVELADRGYAVGLLDADVFGFSVPGQLGLAGSPVRIDDLMVPPVAFGVKAISIGMFVAGNQAVAWRGPMLHRTVSQFLTDVYWGELDYLLIDLPPGTGDIAISLGQLLPQGEHLVITTPQAAAAEVAERSAAVGLQTGQSVLGVIENMSWMTDSSGVKLEIFGTGGGQTVAQALSRLTEKPVELIGQVPIDVELRIGSDSASPIVLSHPDSPAALALKAITDKIVASREPLAGKRLPLSLG
ncbi:MAG: hypothetical protein RL670_1182 [Actinomycetota bacterium]